MPDLNGQERNEVNLEMFKNSFRVIPHMYFFKNPGNVKCEENAKRNRYY